MILVGMKANFQHQAKDVSTFTFSEMEKLMNAIEQARNNSEAVVVDLNSVGHDLAGEQVAEFTFSWSFKKRKPKA